MNASGVEIKSFVAGLARPTSAGPALKDHEQAPTLPVESVVSIEGLVLSAPTLPLRIFAGVVCLCVHGVKRWADVQHVLSLSSTSDGVLLKTYKSKRKDKPLTWAALRRGFGSGIWAEHFQSACLEAQLPRNDFLALRPTTDLEGFTKYPADWADANRCLHALLVIAGMPVEEAV